MRVASSSFTVLLSATAATAAAAAGKKDADSTTCRLWLAPSSMSTDTETKLALFAGVDYAIDEEIPSHELAIPLVDMLEEAYKEGSRMSRDVLEALESHVWAGEFAGGAQFDGNFSTTVLVPGIGAFANYHSGSYNVDWSHGSSLLRERNVKPYMQPGKPHPSRGAITPYYNMTMVATEPIKAGTELLANFGEAWEADKDDDPYSSKVLRSDYEAADKIIDSLIAFMEKFDDQMNDDLKDDILEFVLGKALNAANSKRASAIRSLIPAHPKKLSKVKEAGGSFNYRNQAVVKTDTWLNRNGYCVDNLRPGVSTIPDAGRGAFASKKLAKDEMITLIPLQQVAQKQIMNMYNFVDRPDPQNQGETKLAVDRTAGRIGEQLLVNYCFGHTESSMLLAPLGPYAGLINHAPTGDKKKGANAVLKWSQNWKVHNEHDLGASVQAIAKKGHPLLALELYALRDIKEGEEVLIDYGPEWAAAWESYKAKFNAKYAKGTWPTRADDLLAKYKNTPFPKPEAVPAGISTACIMEQMEVEDGTLRKTADDYFMTTYGGPKTFNEYKGYQLQTCTVISYEKDKENMYNYTVGAFNTEFEGLVHVTQVPHRALTMVDMPYTGDVFAPDAFRHFIGLPDDVFPTNWHNLKKTKATK